MFEDIGQEKECALKCKASPNSNALALKFLGFSLYSTKNERHLLAGRT